MIVNIIVAYCNNNGIGKDNSLVWNIKTDMAKFKKLTIGNANNAVIMGKNTFISLNNEKIVDFHTYSSSTQILFCNF